jgi:hypothetical protein
VNVDQEESRTQFCVSIEEFAEGIFNHQVVSKSLTKRVSAHVIVLACAESRYPLIPASQNLLNKVREIAPEDSLINEEVFDVAGRVFRDAVEPVR